MMGLSICNYINVDNEAAELLLSAQFLAERNDVMSTEKIPGTSRYKI